MRTSLAIFLLLIAAPAAAQTMPPGIQSGPIHVIDGDTVEQGGIRWRLDGIDAPEISHARCASEREQGIRSAARLIELLAQRGGGTIAPETTRRGTIKSGGFGRKLGRLLFGDGTPWADVAIREGHAVAYVFGKQRLPDWCAAAS